MLFTAVTSAGVGGGAAVINREISSSYDQVYTQSRGRGILLYLLTCLKKLFSFMEYFYWSHAESIFYIFTCFVDCLLFLPDLPITYSLAECVY